MNTDSVYRRLCEASATHGVVVVFPRISVWFRPVGTKPEVEQTSYNHCISGYGWTDQGVESGLEFGFEDDSVWL